MQPLLVTFKRLALLAGPGARTLASLVWLTPQRCDLLLRLYRQPLVQRDLAFELGVVRSVVSKMVTGLEQIGLVVRKSIPEDRRLRLVTLTDRAFELIHTLQSVYMTDDDGQTVQQSYEQFLLDRFETDFREKKVGVVDISTEDQRTFLWNIRADVLSSTDEDWVGADMPVAPVHPIPPWKRLHVPPCPKTTGRDAGRADFHRSAGEHLTARQRQRRRPAAGVGTPPRPAAAWCPPTAASGPPHPRHAPTSPTSPTSASPS